MRILYRTERRKYEMKTQNEEKIKKYYTWEGLEDLYDTQADAQKEVEKKKKEGVLKLIDEHERIFAVGFEHKEEAEKFREGKWDEYIQKNYKQLEATEYDAVIYTDGSYQIKNDTYGIASYGLIIFLRGENEPHIESGTIEDVKEEEYQIVRYDEAGNKFFEKDENSKDGVDGENRCYVAAGNSAVGELFGAMRSLEICCKDRRLKKIQLIYDRDGIKQGYDNRKDLSTAEKGVAVTYRKFLQELEEGGFLKDVKIEFTKVDSHGGEDENKPQCKIDADEYPHAVYNDLVDILAKMEIKENIGKVVNPRINFNVFRAISNEFKRFSDIPEADKTEAGDRRKYAREEFVKKVLNKYDGKFRPIF